MSSRKELFRDGEGPVVQAGHTIGCRCVNGEKVWRTQTYTGHSAVLDVLIKFILIFEVGGWGDCVGGHSGCGLKIMIMDSDQVPLLRVEVKVESPFFLEKRSIDRSGILIVGI